jgi:hypothetical protein
MSVALAYTTDLEIRYGVVVAGYHIRVAEPLVSKRVHPVELQPNVGKRYPFLQIWKIVKRLVRSTLVVLRVKVHLSP